MLVRFNLSFITLDMMKQIFEDLGIKEDIPQPSSGKDYKKLSPASIRTINTINYYLDQNNLENFNKLIPEGEIQKVSILSAESEYSVDCIKYNTLKIILRKIKAITHSADIDETLTEFLQLSSEFDQLLSVKRLNRLINEVRKSRYFSFFGTKMRTLTTNQIQNLDGLDQNSNAVKQMISSMLSNTNNGLVKVTFPDDAENEKKRLASDVIQEWRQL